MKFMVTFVMITKNCRICKQNRPIEDYTKCSRSSDQFGYECKNCRTVIFKKYYLANKTKQSKKAVDWKRKKRNEAFDYIKAIKAVTPCVDCKIQYPPYVMDFDHRDPTIKLFSIGSMAKFRATLEDVKTEIAKCDIVCANCHRMRTHNQGF